MRNCEVLIVGGGPAGSSCARRLRQAGLDAVILDRRDFPRHKVCAGWITPPIVEALQLDLADYQSTRVLQPIRGFRVSMMGGPEARTFYDEPVSYGIRRCEFDDYLLRRCGARMWLGESLQSIERVGSRWRINGEIETPMLVGAGGHFCPVARHLGATPSGRGQRVVAAQEVEFEMTPEQVAACPVRGEVPELFFCRDLTGYAWIFRKGNWLNVGLGREDTGRIGEHVAAFVKFLEERGRIPCGITEKFNGHAYILYGHTIRPVVDDGVLLIGDAAGLAYPQSGEGIRPAIESGIMAGQTLIAAQGRYDRTALRPYADALVGRFGNPRPHESATWLPQAWKQRLAARLLGTRWFARHVVVERWFLHRHQTALSV